MELTILGRSADADPLEYSTVLRLAERLRRLGAIALYGPDQHDDLAEQMSRMVRLPLRQLPFGGVLTEIIAAHAGENVIVVSSSGPIRELIADVLDVPVGVVPAPDAGSITRVRASRSGVRSLLCLNDNLHAYPVDEVDRPRDAGIEGVHQ